MNSNTLASTKMSHTEFMYCTFHYLISIKVLQETFSHDKEFKTADPIPNSLIGQETGNYEVVLFGNQS